MLENNTFYKRDDRHRTIQPDGRNSNSSTVRGNGTSKTSSLWSHTTRDGRGKGKPQSLSFYKGHRDRALPTSSAGLGAPLNSYPLNWCPA